jgi:hypothetical protein
MVDHGTLQQQYRDGHRCGNQIKTFFKNIDLTGKKKEKRSTWAQVMSSLFIHCLDSWNLVAVLLNLERGFRVVNAKQKFHPS